MLSISLSDPGMFNTSIAASNWEDVQDALRSGVARNYTQATFYEIETGRHLGFADRQVGESEWVVRRAYMVTIEPSHGGRFEVRRLFARDEESAVRLAEKLVGSSGRVTHVEAI